MKRPLHGTLHHDVTVTRAGQSQTVRLKLQPGAAVQTITLP